MNASVSTSIDHVRSFVERYLPREDCLELVLASPGKGGRADILDTFPADGDLSVDTIVQHIMDGAGAEAGESERRFYVLATANGDRVLGRCKFTCAPASLQTAREMSLSLETGAMAPLADDLELGGGNMPTKLTKALIQGSIQKDRLALGAMQSLVRELVGMHRSSVERISRIEAKHMEAMELVEKLLDRKHERDLERQEQEATEARRARMMERFEKDIMPLLVGHMSGGDQLHQLLGDLPQEQLNPLIGSLMEHLGPEKVGQIIGLLQKGEDAEKAAARMAGVASDDDGGDG